MKLSQNAIDAFQWCGKLNPDLVLNPGQTIRTITHNKAVLLKVLVEEHFPTLCAFNLAAFLRDLDTGTDVNFDCEDYVLLSKGRTATKVPKLDPKLVMSPPNKELNVSNFEETVFLHIDDLQQMPAAKRVSFSKSKTKPKTEYIFEFHAAKAGAPIMLDIIREDLVRTIDLKVSRQAKQPFKARIRQRNLVLMDGSYEIAFSKVGVSRWRGVNVAAVIWIATESKHCWFGEQERDKKLEEERLRMDAAAKAELAGQ